MKAILYPRNKTLKPIEGLITYKKRWHKINAESKLYLLELLKAGFPPKQLSDQYYLSVTVFYHLNKNPIIKLNDKPLKIVSTKLEDKPIFGKKRFNGQWYRIQPIYHKQTVDLIKEGFTIAQLSKFYNISMSTLRKWLHEAENNKEDNNIC